MRITIFNNYKNLILLFLIFFFCRTNVFCSNPDSFKVADNYLKKEFQIPMRDGVKLFTAVYIPKDQSVKYPILLCRTPYAVAPYGENKFKDEIGPSQLFAKEGYIIVYQDVRGKFMSEGEFVDVRPFIKNKKSNKDIDESSDTYDTVEWLIKNIQNNNGKVGVWGISYPGFYAGMSAMDSHPAVVAVSPQAPIADWFIGDDFHHNGAFFLPHAFNFYNVFGVPRPNVTQTWSQGVSDFKFQDGYKFFLEMGSFANTNKKYFKEKIPFWNELMQHGSYDEYWKARSTLNKYENIKTAVMTVGGWFDAEDLFGALKTYRTIENKNKNTYNILVMGPWAHGGWSRSTGNSLGNISFNSNTSEFYREQIELKFFNYYLKEKGDLTLPEAYIFNTGANEWRTFNEWPPQKAEEKKIFLQVQNKLSFESPIENSKNLFEEYISDPNKPVPFTAEITNRMTREYIVEDQRFVWNRPDVLSFELDELKEDITFAGPIEANLFVSTTGTDADWIVKLIDVFPDSAGEVKLKNSTKIMSGFQMLVRGEVMRGKFRNSFEKPEPFIPNKITKVSFSIPDVCHTFKKGHKIMIQIQSSWFPLVDRNPQKFVDIYNCEEYDFQKATHKIYFSKDYSSYLKVNILK